MNRKFSLIAVVLACFMLSACNDNEEAATAPAVVIHDGYNATLAEGIQFSAKPNYPSFIKSVAGMSGNEPTGRWSEGKHVIFTFTQNLPATFTVELDLVSALGPNAGQLAKIRVGDWEQMFEVETKPNTQKFYVKTSKPSDSIEFIIPKPTSPKELGASDDPRKLGILFKRLSITKD